jgi:peptide deformylase
MTGKKDTIVQYGHKVLHEKAKEVPLKDIGSKKLNAVIEKMKLVLGGEEDGVAIAAPQLGLPLRLFVVSKRAYRKGRTEGTELTDQVFINPVILKLSKEKKPMEEGCLSVRRLYGKVERHIKTKLTAYNERGEKVTVGASGLLAQIFQHETDHLDGTLFIDKALDVVEISEEELDVIKKREKAAQERAHDDTNK